MAHTPGPWSYWPKTGHAIGSITQDSTAQHIAYPAFDNPANANLIAAAPELLHSLKELLPMLVEWGKNPIYHTQAESNIIGFAEDAIAKAEGRQ
jgi:hypothetical protein